MGKKSRQESGDFKTNRLIINAGRKKYHVQGMFLTRTNGKEQPVLPKVFL
jgi:hypothetical protein